MGDVELETSIGCKLVLKDVRHVPEIRFSLISIGKLGDEGNHSHLEEGKMKPFIELWHKWLGHISEKRLQVLARKKLLPVKVHIDVCTMQSNTLGGALYYVTFIDDHSRKVAHNGGEYRGPFEQYCRSHGIKLEKMVPKTPQQNGVAKRMNRTICDRIRCMLSHAKLPKSFWGEAMRKTVDLINLSPSYPLEGDIPKRHLRVFGCKAFVHVPRGKRSKFDSKTK
ncbi:hypothetical protein AAG906_018959 [Vitis piasezkii]